MNKTQRLIILTGNEGVWRTALETIMGFKAITCIKHINDEIIENVFKHNKNVLHAMPVYDIKLAKYNPIIINVVKSGTDIDSMRLGLDNIMEDFPKILDSKDVDSGDHITEDSSSVKTNTCDCLLCKIADGNPIRPEHILYESDSFFVVPGLGAFFEGYVMIVPKRHVMSFAELNTDEYEEFLQVLNDIRFILESIYNKKIFVFECGSGKNGGGKNATSIVHAHIHLAPTDMPVLKNVQDSGIHPGLILPRQLSNYGTYPYMLYIDQEDNWYIASDPNSYYPRQHPRQVLAHYMGLEKGKYNWRIFRHEEKMDIIAEEFYSFIRANLDTLPAWIRNCTEKFI